MSVIRGEIVTISASSVKSSSSNSGVVQFPPGLDAAQFVLNVTASSSPTTLDVYLQWSSDGGTTWWDFGHFAQVGAVSTSKQILLWSRRVQLPTILATSTTTGTVMTGGDAVLPASQVVNGPIVENYVRGKWVLSGSSYTFSLSAVVDKD